MKTLRVLFLFCVVCAVAFCQGFLNVEDLLLDSRNVTLTDYPNANYAIVDNIVEVKYKADGTYVSVDDTAVKILTEAGRKDHQMLSTSYTKAYGTSEFTLVQIISPDGKIRTLDVKDICNESIDDSQMGSNIYDPNHKVLTATISDLKVNDIIRYVVKHNEYKVRMPNTFADYYVLEYRAPIKGTEIRVNAPKALPLVHKEILAKVGDTVKYQSKQEKDGSTTHIWKATEVPQALPEPKMPKMYTCVQRVLMGTVEKWEDISAWYWKLSEPHFKPSAEMQAKVSELIAGAHNDQEKANAIFRFVSQEIRYMGETTEKEAPGYEPHDAAVTFAKRHGVCRDKAALLTAMMRIAGLEAYPVLINAGPKKDKEVPQPFFNHAITALRAPDGTFKLLDSTNENTADWMPAYLDNCSFLVATPTGETLRVSPVRDANENLADITVHCDINAEGTLLGYASIKCTGINDNAYRGSLARWSEEQRRNYLEKIVKRAISGSRITRLKLLPEDIRNTREPFEIQLSFEAKDYVVKKDDCAYIAVPAFIENVGVANWLLDDISLDKRRFPMVCSCTAAINEKLTVNIAPEWGALLGTMNYSDIDDECYEWKRHASFVGDLLVCESRCAVKSTEISPEQYLKLKNTMTAQSNDLEKMLVFIPSEQRPEAEEEKDVVVLEDKSDVVVDNFGKIRNTNTVRIGICTYGGLKKYSELKLSFCPDFEKIKLNYAKVFNNDICTELKLDEVKIMDTGWTADAARYPAQKLLVANMPGVKVGSVIEYQYEYEYAGDMPFSRIDTFAGFFKILSKTVNVTLPKEIKTEISVTQNGYLNPNDGENIDGVMEEGIDTVTCSWTASNQQPIKQEDHLPLLRMIVPSVSISTTSWKDLASLINEKLIARADADIEGKKLEELTAQLLPYKPLRQIRALKTYVEKNIRQAGPALNAIPLDMLSGPERTIVDGYGNAADRALVYYTVLRKLGMSPEIVLASSRIFAPEDEKRVLEFATPNVFVYPIVRVKAGGNYIWLNDSDEYAYPGTCAFENHLALFSNGKIAHIEVDKELATQKLIDLSIELDALGNAIITQNIVYSGNDYGPMKRRFAEQTPEERRRYLLKKVTAFSLLAQPEDELTTDFEAYPGRVSLRAKVPAYAVQNGPLFTLAMGNLFAGKVPAPLDKRTLPYACTDYDKQTMTVWVSYPEENGFTVLSAPDSEKYAFPVKKAFVRTADVNSKAAVFEYKMNLVPFQIASGDYPKLLDFNKRLEHQPFNSLVFLKKEE